ncbi:MAG TPA: hypothetical protein VFS54_06385 [Solirubrobacterales bacterium]|nr:hypothetical protein [Solirubrobacterales bacterium]
MRAPRLAPATLALLAAGALLSACGGDSDTGESTASGGETSPSRPAPPKAEFPSTRNRTLRQVLKAADGPAEAKIAASAEVFYPGVNRYPFSVSNRESGGIDDAEVALYFAKAPTPHPGSKSKPGNRGQAAKAQQQALDQPAVGPFPASIESLATKPAFRADSTAEDPDAARVVYSAQLNLPSAGEWRIAAIVREDGELRGTPVGTAVVGEFKRIPRPGQRAPTIHTPTAQDVGGELSKITTRIPPDTQNKVDYAEALGKEPIVLLFATPEFCQSRVCGPVVDVAEQAKKEYGDKAAFIHMEIYNDNDPAKRVRPQVRAFHLPTEPYLFTIDSGGIVRAAVEGPFGLKLMHEAVDKAIAG